MPKINEHLAQKGENNRLSETLKSGIVHHDWQIVAIYYEVLHHVQASISFHHVKIPIDRSASLHDRRIAAVRAKWGETPANKLRALLKWSYSARYDCWDPNDEQIAEARVYADSICSIVRPSH